MLIADGLVAFVKRARPTCTLIEKPIQNRTAGELRKIADDIVEPAPGMLTAGG
jgi:hypothetical protein